jgi:hypothetical protein
MGGIVKADAVVKGVVEAAIRLRGSGITPEMELE